MHTCSFSVINVLLAVAKVGTLHIVVMSAAITQLIDIDTQPALVYQLSATVYHEPFHLLTTQTVRLALKLV